jgi:hypothetical protein
LGGAWLRSGSAIAEKPGIAMVCGFEVGSCVL